MALWINGTLVEGTDDAVRVTSPPLLEFEWGSGAKPSPLAYTRSGTWLVRDNVAQSALVSKGANAWTAEMHGDGYRYLPHVPTYANLIPHPRDFGASGWTPGTATVDDLSADGPDGSTNSAWRFTCTEGQFGPYFSDDVYTGTNPYVYTIWVRDAAASGFYNLYFSPDVDVPSILAAGGAHTNAWHRVAIALATNDGNTLGATTVTGTDLSAFGGLTARALDNYVDLAMVTQSRIALPWTAGTIGNSILALAGSSVVAPNGRFDVTLTTDRLVHREAATGPTANTYLLYSSANDHFMFRASDHKYVLTLGGSVVAASAAKSYGADHSLGPPRVWGRGDSCGFAIDGATVEAAAVAPIAVPATAYLLSNNGASSFASDLRLGAGGRFIARHPR